MRRWNMRRHLKSTLTKVATRLAHIFGEETGGLTAEWAQKQELRNVSVGKGTYGTPVIVGLGEDYLEIGSFVSISADVKIVLANHDTAAVSLYPFRAVDWKNSAFRVIPAVNVHASSKGPVRIGHDVWLGDGCVVLPGVTIGSGAVVGARAVVSRDVPPYGVAVGNPARVAKFRVSKNQVEELLQISWWNWDQDALIEAEADFLLPVDVFIEKHRND